MITSEELQTAVEARLGDRILSAEFLKAEFQARLKINRINRMAGRNYGDEGYGDKYLVVLTSEIIQDNRFRDYINNRSRLQTAINKVIV